MAQVIEFSIVGRGTLAMSCTQQILERGLRVRAFVSTDRAAVAWAARLGLAAGAGMSLLAKSAEGTGGGVLLSISNDRLVPPELLRIFRLAVNFHDGPLPRYSGSHATSWALMAGERRYAISWHRMTDRVDAGEIYLEEPIAIAADETAFSLNGKAHVAALTSFPRLVDAIVCGSLTGRPQNLRQRQFYPRDRRPDRCAVLDFDRPAHELNALARALAFGDHPNRLGVPKLWDGKDFLAVRRVDVLATRSRSEPGTVAQLRPEGIEVATSTHDVRLAGLCTLDGEPLDMQALAARPGLREGNRLPTEGAAIGQAIAGAASSHWRDEEFWVARLRGMRPLVLPMADSAGEPAELSAALHRDRPAKLLARTVRSLARTCGTPRFEIGLEHPADRGALVARVLPFSVAVNAGTGAEEQDGQLMKAFAAWIDRAPYLRDAPLRYPGLALPAGWKHFSDWPVVVSLSPGSDQPRASLHITLDASSGVVRLRTRDGSISAPAMREIVRNLQAEQ